MKIVINKCYGGFGLSRKAMLRYAEIKGFSEQTIYDRDIDRTDPALIQVVEELGLGAAGSAADLAIVNIPDDVEWHIEEYDGNEWVAESHRTWS